MQTGFVDWCDACSWNLSAPEEPEATGRLERLYERVGARMGDRLNATHPPTAKRLELLEGRRHREPKVVLDGERAAAVDAELARHHRRIQARLVDEHRDRLYY